MSELLVILAIIAVIAIVWYLRKESTKDAEQRKVDEFRRLRAAADAEDRAAASAAVAEGTRDVGRGGGLLQQAADTASGKRFETATGQLEEMTAGLAAARQQAEREAQQLLRRADETLAAVQAAAEAHGGAVPGDGTHDCPPDYPIKGNMGSRLYHHPHQPSYGRTIPEVCFQTEAAAEAAGFAPARDEPGAPSRRPAAGSVVVEEVVVVDVDEQGRVDVTDDTMAAAAMPPMEGERDDLVAEAIAAADAGGVPPGAIRGDGSRDCPPAYPIKGNQSSMVYHLPGTDTYQSTIPELCFSSAESAEAAGVRSTRH
jgi:hypothetical protein